MDARLGVSKHPLPFTPYSRPAPAASSSAWGGGTFLIRVPRRLTDHSLSLFSKAHIPPVVRKVPGGSQRAKAGFTQVSLQLLATDSFSLLAPAASLSLPAPSVRARGIPTPDILTHCSCYPERPSKICTVSASMMSAPIRCSFPLILCDI